MCTTSTLSIHHFKFLLSRVILASATLYIDFCPCQIIERALLSAKLTPRQISWVCYYKSIRSRTTFKS
jgi:hypothetical protein